MIVWFRAHQRPCGGQLEDRKKTKFCAACASYSMQGLLRNSLPTARQGFASQKRRALRETAPSETNRVLRDSARCKSLETWERHWPNRFGPKFGNLSAWQFRKASDRNPKLSFKWSKSYHQATGVIESGVN